MEVRYQLVRLLADGRPRSGAALARGLGVSRARVPRLVEQLAALDLHVEALRGRGYRLTHPLELLDAERILAALSPSSRAVLAGLEVLAEVDSTSRHLRSHPARGDGGVRACLAEMQTAGRGRSGRAWVSPFGANVYLSVMRRFALEPAALQGLSLCVGIAAARAVSALGAMQVALKWPNDLLLDGRKLGGVLIEASAAGVRASDVVAGIGINVCVPDRVRGDIDQPFVDLHTAGVRVERNRLAARLIDEVTSVAERFEAQGFAAFRDEWLGLDALRGREVELSGAGGRVRGRAQGVDGDGALLLNVGGRPRRIVSAEVSVRPIERSSAVEVAS